MKRYHKYTLTLGLAPESPNSSATDDATSPDIEQTCGYSIQRIGTAMEKQSVEKELAELRERLGKVDEWERRRTEIDEELSRVLTSGGRTVPPPAYQARDDEGKGDGGAARVAEAR